MNRIRGTIFVLAAAVLLGACEPGEEDVTGTEAETAAPVPTSVDGEIMPGLTARTLEQGHGRPAEPGDFATVHYTGWLYDENSPDGRGTKFDSSVDRGDRFQFALGAGHVIRGWDEGIPGMLIGEKRELIIEPELAYGDRGAGDVIPPGATLVFEVELFALEAPGDAG